ncbi:TIGR04283 family arsenosugar biosynthesis glycosyltransferase [Chrysiogenes arsenatis]|uniref:TIGR04283 family arsenosugar biosynthesis glycosyltransferase n=1 Tax=Chrysiogenes arsenatis TaxID=309797 RepID=UPI0012682224|nr:TIGR04283 family arsenosugar biosynthesis glycosyltransferase [Chrysiogenes arsenatis]
MSRQLILFTRYPQAGTTKTRLIPTLGAAKAALLQRRMTEHAITTARQLRQTTAHGIRLHVSYSGGHPRDFRAWLGSDIDFTSQPLGDLGARLHHSFGESFAHGSAATLVLGSDIPAITPQLLAEAFDQLEKPETDVVIGPTVDGGYYLIGLKKPCAALFQAIDWGTDVVRQQTVQICQQHGLQVAELPMLSDVDTAEDLMVLRDDERFAEIFAHAPKISIVIPTFNEAAIIEKTLASIPHDQRCEVIVVDGGSADDTIALAARHGARVLICHGGRAAQLNRGAEEASGHILLFLHADTRLPEQFGEQIRAVLQDPATVAGAFHFQTDGGGWQMRLVAWMTNLRAKWLQLPYGDQAIFLEKRIFAEIGGFPPLPIMEDYAFMRRLRQCGRIMLAPSAVITSARRWQQLGVCRTTIINQCMLLGYHSGVSIDLLRRLYLRAKKR